jgi:hypothetical protein
MSLDETSRQSIVDSAAKIPAASAFEESGDRLRRIVAGQPQATMPTISESVAGLGLNPPAPDNAGESGYSSSTQGVINNSERGAQPASAMEEEWKMDFGDLTKVFPDANERERVRRLLDAASNPNGKFAASARVELAQIKNNIEASKSNNQTLASPRTELTQPEIDRMSKEIRQGNIG